MVTGAPNANANQALSLKDAVQDNEKVSEDLIIAAASWSSSMGGMGIPLGAELNNSSGANGAMTVVGTIGLGGTTVGASYFNHDHSNSTGYTLGAEHSLGPLTPGIGSAVEEYDAVDSNMLRNWGL